jgi:hypothetical protein
MNDRVPVYYKSNDIKVTILIGSTITTGTGRKELTNPTRDSLPGGAINYQHPIALDRPAKIYAI